MLVRWIGERAFVAMFSAVAALLMGVLAFVVAVHGGEGPPGAGLGRLPGVRIVLGLVSFAGATLAAAGTLNYMRSPMAVFRAKVRPAAGIERITRHPFFMGLAAYAIAHALLASTLAVAIYFAGYAVLAIGGAHLQDRKLTARHGDEYATYVARTSFLPFAGLLRREPLWVRGESLVRQLASSMLIAGLVLVAHPWLSMWHGALLAVGVALGGLVLLARGWPLRDHDGG
jgi:uncharacterized membrane protein